MDYRDNDRRIVVLHAATSLIAAAGTKGLTHRGVDARAGLPPGSTSNLFRSREHLVTALVAHIAALELGIIETHLRPTGAPTTHEYAVALTRFVAEATTTGIERSRARFALALDPLAQTIVTAARARIDQTARALLHAAGHPHPAGAAGAGLAFIDGVIFADTCLDQTHDPETVRDTLTMMLTTSGRCW